MPVIANAKKQIGTLAPASFALVMSTGIVSMGSHLLKLEDISRWLFVLNKLQFAVLVFLLAARLFLFFKEVLKDISSHAQGAGFLTLVAAACLLAMQYVLFDQNFEAGIILGFFSLVMWLVIMYSFFIAVVTKTEKPSLEKGLNGSWLLVVVATQSLSILASTLQEHLPVPIAVTAFFSLCAILLGFFLYVVIITIILQRLLFSQLTAAEFTASYWIDIGACAITALAALTFIGANKDNISFSGHLPFLRTIAVLCWAVSTWWLPLIVILEAWRHITKRFPVKYTASYWSMVFPLGMYTVCTLKITDVLQFSFLQSVPHVFIYVSLAAWISTFLAMCFNITRSLLADGPAA